MGAHLSSGNAATIATTHQMGKQNRQLENLKYCPVVTEATKAIAIKVYAAAFYGIEAVEVATAKVAQSTTAVIEVFRSKKQTLTGSLLPS